MPERRAAPRRKPVSLTSLIDVIFLLLLFFMLTSTFARHGDLTLGLAGNGPAGETTPAFLRIGPDALALDTTPLALADLPRALAAQGASLVLVAPMAEVNAQRLVDVLGALDGVPGVSVLVLGGR